MIDYMRQAPPPALHYHAECGVDPLKCKGWCGGQACDVDLATRQATGKCRRHRADDFNRERQRS